MIDFKTTNINEPSVQLSQADVLGHLAFTATTMQWFNGKGKELLEDPVAHTRLVWDELFLKAFVLYRDFSHTRTVKELFVRVIERGIADVTALAKGMAEVKQFFEPSTLGWIQHMMGFVAPGEFCGFNGGACNEKKTRELLENLMVAVQAMKSTELLFDLTCLMAPRNELVQNLLAEHYHANW
jgi:hypothetical protein